MDLSPDPPMHERIAHMLVELARATGQPLPSPDTPPPQMGDAEGEWDPTPAEWAAACELAAQIWREDLRPARDPQEQQAVTVATQVAAVLTDLFGMVAKQGVVASHADNALLSSWCALEPESRAVLVFVAWHARTVDLEALEAADTAWAYPAEFLLRTTREEDGDEQDWLGETFPAPPRPHAGWIFATSLAHDTDQLSTCLGRPCYSSRPVTPPATTRGISSGDASVPAPGARSGPGLARGRPRPAGRSPGRHRPGPAVGRSQHGRADPRGRTVGPPGGGPAPGPAPGIHPARPVPGPGPPGPRTGPGRPDLHPGPGPVRAVPDSRGRRPARARNRRPQRVGSAGAARSRHRPPGRGSTRALAHHPPGAHALGGQRTRHHRPEHAAALARDQGPDDLTLITRVGAPARVDHLVWHLVPREHGDGLSLPWDRTALPAEGSHT